MAQNPHISVSNIWKSFSCPEYGGQNLVFEVFLGHTEDNKQASDRCYDIFSLKLAWFYNTIKL